MISLIQNKGLKQPKLIIEKKLHDKIIYLCSRISQEEWSGVLFYEMKGVFGGDLELIAKDLLLLDINTASYTEYENDTTDIPAYMFENNLIHTYQGHIHSHNVMQTFFSGTDLATLKEEGAKRPHFLSLIVNNANEYTACITAKAEVKEELIFKDFSGQILNILSPETTEPKISVHYISTEIECESNDELVLLDLRIKEINKNKSVTNTTFNKFGYGKYNYGAFTDYEDDIEFLTKTMHKSLPKDENKVTTSNGFPINHNYTKDTEYSKNLLENLLVEQNKSIIDEYVNNTVAYMLSLNVTFEDNPDVTKEDIKKEFLETIVPLDGNDLEEYLHFTEVLLEDNCSICVAQTSALDSVEKAKIAQLFLFGVKQAITDLSIKSDKDTSYILECIFASIEVLIEQEDLDIEGETEVTPNLFSTNYNNFKL